MGIVDKYNLDRRNISYLFFLRSMKVRLYFVTYDLYNFPLIILYLLSWSAIQYSYTFEYTIAIPEFYKEQHKLRQFKDTSRAQCAIVNT